MSIPTYGERRHPGAAHYRKQVAHTVVADMWAPRGLGSTEKEARKRPSVRPGVCCNRKDRDQTWSGHIDHPGRPPGRSGHIDHPGMSPGRSGHIDHPGMPPR